MKVKSYAKINIGLDVVSKRTDGYHNIKTIMQKISLYDEIEFKKINRGFVLESNVDSLNNKENLIYKVWEAICKDQQRDLGISVRLKKNLPLAAGIAGGTGNGAITLKALNDLYNLNISHENLKEIGLGLGADFPYMLSGGTVLAQGIGEELRDLKDFSDKKVLIINPGYGISTKDVYKSIKIDNKRVDFDKIIEAMDKNDIVNLGKFVENKMETSVFSKHRDLLDIKKRLGSICPCVLMSGSGATIFGIFEDDVSLDKAYKLFLNECKYCYKSTTIGGRDEF